jgi:hypothetical protein
MNQSELTLRATGVNYRARLTTEKSKENRIRKIERGKLESFTSLDGRFNLKRKKNGNGTFYSRWDEDNVGDTSFHTLRLHEGGRLIEIREYVNYCGCGEIFGVIRTKNHWYEKWKGRKLKNPNLSWTYL